MTTKGAVVDARAAWLLTATFLVAVAGLIYELIAATLSSYLLGDSVRQFSLVIGIFLSAMGFGAWMSRFVGAAFAGFVWAQILMGVIGGFMAPALFFIYAWTGHVETPLYATLIAIGVLSGMEIPLIARVLEQIGALRFRFENVLSVDYLGALIASLAFPLLVIPHLGLMSASLAFGALNLLVAGLSLVVFWHLATRAQVIVLSVAFAATLGALWHAEKLVSVSEALLFEDEVILSETTPYQQITITRFRDRVRLFLDHSIQFDSLDEHRYHESLVHPAMALAPRRTNILILGGGDGMALREVLRYGDVHDVTLVDLDPRVTEVFRKYPDLSKLNSGALSDPRVTIVHQDAWKFVEADRKRYDVVIIDLPDPKSIALSRLYTRQFYGLLAQRLSAQALIATQAGSPFFARQAFWCVVETIQSSRNPHHPSEEGLSTIAYHSYVPSFGEWGFVLASPMPLAPRPLRLPGAFSNDLRYFTPDVWQAAQVFGRDIAPVEVEPNTLQSHVLTTYYLDGWNLWFR